MIFFTNNIMSLWFAHLYHCTLCLILSGMSDYSSLDAESGPLLDFPLSIVFAYNVGI